MTFCCEHVILLLNLAVYTKACGFLIARKIGDKISYTLLQDDEVVLLGKILIASQTENIQDYSKKTNNKFYN